jgi:hypothetical protein
MHSLTKFDHGFAKLPASVALVMRELAQRVRTGEVDDLYQQLEAKLTVSYQKSSWQNVFSSWTLPDMRDR